MTTPSHRDRLEIHTSSVSDSATQTTPTTYSSTLASFPSPFSLQDLYRQQGQSPVAETSRALFPAKHKKASSGTNVVAQRLGKTTGVLGNTQQQPQRGGIQTPKWKIRKDANIFTSADHQTASSVYPLPQGSRISSSSLYEDPSAMKTEAPFSPKSPLPSSSNNSNCFNTERPPQLHNTILPLCYTCDEYDVRWLNGLKANTGKRGANGFVDWASVELMQLLLSAMEYEASQSHPHVPVDRIVLSNSVIDACVAHLKKQQKTTASSYYHLHQLIPGDSRDASVEEFLRKLKSYWLEKRVILSCLGADVAASTGAGGSLSLLNALRPSFNESEDHVNTMPSNSEDNIPFPFLERENTSTVGIWRHSSDVQQGVKPPPAQALSFAEEQQKIKKYYQSTLNMVAAMRDREQRKFKHALVTVQELALLREEANTSLTASGQQDWHHESLQRSLMQNIAAKGMPGISGNRLGANLQEMFLPASDSSGHTNISTTSGSQQQKLKELLPQYARLPLKRLSALVMMNSSLFGEVKKKEEDETDDDSN